MTSIQGRHDILPYVLTQIIPLGGTDYSPKKFYEIENERKKYANEASTLNENSPCKFKRSKSVLSYGSARFDRETFYQQTFDNTHFEDRRLSDRPFVERQTFRRQTLGQQSEETFKR